MAFQNEIQFSGYIYLTVPGTTNALMLVKTLKSILSLFGFFGLTFQNQVASFISNVSGVKR